VLERFRGSFLQTPPPFSAKKVASVPAYEKARKNQPIELRPVEVTVRELELVGTSDIGSRTSDIGQGGLLRLRVAVSAGFYVRSLAHDIGQVLGCGAHLEALRRTRVGRFRAEDGLTLDRVEAEGRARVRSPNDVLGHMPAVTLTEDGARRVSHGNPIRETGSGAEPVRLLDPTGGLLAIAERRAGGLLQPVVVLR
jgi:tRNA pseudouridine55 synthase